MHDTKHSFCRKKRFFVIGYNGATVSNKKGPSLSPIQLYCNIGKPNVILLLRV